MAKLRTKVLYHGGSLKVPTRYQKGVLALRRGKLSFRAKGRTPQEMIDLTIPVEKLRRVTLEERMYYSSIGYFLRIEFVDDGDVPGELIVEVRSFLRRLRALLTAKKWVEVLRDSMGKKWGEKI
jgi:hypothetical protein